MALQPGFLRQMDGAKVNLELQTSLWKPGADAEQSKTAWIILSLSTRGRPEPHSGDEGLHKALLQGPVKTNTAAAPTAEVRLFPPVLSQFLLGIPHINVFCQKG